MNTMEIWLEYIGRFHPIVLHLPIGALLFTYLIALLGLKEYDSFRKTLLLGIIFSFASALIASLLGLLLYTYGAYDKGSIQSHMILGWITTLSIAVLWGTFEKVQYKNVFIPLFTFSIISLSLTGHFGGQITHGETYLELPTPQAKVLTVTTDSILVYKQAVAKIFSKKCVSCHNYSKRKGGLALHLPEAILAGGENGSPYVMGNAEESKIIRYASLPLEDKMHMPPKGRPQLTPSEIKVLAYWIDQGAAFDASVNLKGAPKELKQPFAQFLPEELPDVSSLSPKALIDLKNNGFRVTRYIADKPFLEVKFEGDKLGEKEVRALAKAANQIVELQISGYELPDVFWEEIDQFNNLYKLRLDKTTTQDKQLEQLLKLPLSSLNVAQTQISAKGLSTLFSNQSLENLYAWGTNITREEERKLQTQTPINLVFGVFQGFAEKQKLKPPRLSIEKTLFDSVLEVTFSNKIRGNIIRYTLDGTEPDSTSTVYEKPIRIDKTLTLKSRSFKSGWLPSNVFSEDYFKVNMKVQSYQMLTRPSNRYSGVHKLFDFEEGSTNFADGKWIGFSGNDMVFTTKVAASNPIRNITVSCMESIGGWIIYPKSIRVMGRKNSEPFVEIGRYTYRPKKIPTETTKKSFTVNVSTQEISELKVVVENIQKLPKWHPAAGEDAWLFVDEVLFW